MEHFIYLVMMTFVMTFLSPSTWLIAGIAGILFDNLLVIAIVCFGLRGGLDLVLWLTATSATDEVNESILYSVFYIVPEVAAIFVIAVITRAVREIVLRRRTDSSDDRRASNR